MVKLIHVLLEFFFTLLLAFCLLSLYLNFDMLFMNY